MSTAPTAAEPAGRAAAPAAQRGVRKWPATFTVMLGMMSTIMASTMINIAIPDIMGAFGVGQDQAQWMSTAFLSAMTATMLLNAWFMHNLGARNTFLLATAVFVGASIFGQYAPTFEGVVAARVAQGACAGLLQPLAMSVIFPAFPPEQRGMAMGIYGIGVILGPALGPTFGGIIVDNVEWRFVFTAALPLTVVAGALAMRTLPGRAESGRELKLNWTSFALVCIAIATFLSAVSNGQRAGWGSDFVLGLFMVSAMATLAFFIVESVSRQPLIQIRLFAEPGFAVSSLVGFLFGAGMFGSMYLLPLFMQIVAGYSATKAGWLLMVAGLALVPVFPLGGRLAQHMRPGYPIATGMLLFALSSFALARADADSGFWWLAGWAAFGRIGLGLVIPSLNFGALRAVRPELLPYGVGTLNFVRMLGGAIGVNALAISLEQRTAYHADLFAVTQTADNPLSRELLRRVVELLAREGIGVAERLPLALHYLGQMIGGRATGFAFQDSFTILAWGFVLGTVAALILTRRRDRPALTPLAARAR